MCEYYEKNHSSSHCDPPRDVIEAAESFRDRNKRSVTLCNDNDFDNDFQNQFKQ